MSAEPLLRSLGLEARTAGQHHHATRGWVNTDCPRCSPRSGKYRLGVSEDCRSANCWVCGPFRVGEILAEASGKPLGHVLALLGPFRGRPLPRGDREPARGTLKLPVGCGELLPQHRRYLEGRGFDPDEIVRLWGVRGTGPLGRHCWRLVIPVVSEGEVVSWTARAVADGCLRYLAAKPDEEVVPAKSVLYGMDYVRHCAVVHEGPTDVWRTGPGAVATLGMGYSKRQLLALSRIPVRGVCFDNSPDAQARADRLCRDLAAFPGVTVRLRIDSEDPGSAGEDEVRGLREFIEG